MLRAPFSSEFDPSEEAEGSVDPLGLQPGYERLADRLLPAVTVRMGRPRFVTAMAIGACVCSDCDSDTVAADSITPPWLVWEWLLVEAFVRAEESLAARTNIPGIQKVQRALRNQRPVSASAYLKTPGTFGFTGVFRRLALGLGILTEDGRIDDGGYELVTAWAKDQGLEGFIDASSGDGCAFRERLRRAVFQGLEKGHTTPQPKDFWHTLVQRFDPARPGRRESKVLLSRILSRAGPMDMVARLKESLVARGGVTDRESEPAFIRRLSRHSPMDLTQLLTAIDAYEGFARTITNAFDGLRHCASINGGAPIAAEEFSAAKAPRTALAALGPCLKRIRAHPTMLGWESDRERLVQALDRFERVRTGADLFDAVLEYHEQVQKEKPPNGKRSWFERAPRGRVVVRSGYLLPELSKYQAGYVHEYRIPTFSRFLGDLGALR
jgi:hypothetical protein